MQIKVKFSLTNQSKFFYTLYFSTLSTYNLLLLSWTGNWIKLIEKRHWPFTVLSYDVCCSRQWIQIRERRKMCPALLTVVVTVIAIKINVSEIPNEARLCSDSEKKNWHVFLWKIFLYTLHTRCNQRNHVTICR